MDRVFKRSSVTFWRGSTELASNFHLADNVRFVFAKTKNGGGETRTVWIMNHDLCPIKALISMFQKNPTVAGSDALFSWPSSTTRLSKGVTYSDILLLLKQAALALGTDPKEIGTHSLRRGGCTAYLMAGASYAQCKLYGRWRSDCVREYVECWEDMFKDVGRRVVQGYQDPGRVVSSGLPERPVQLAEAKLRWERFQEETLAAGRRRQGDLFVYS